MKTLLDAGFEGSLLNLQTRYLRKLFTVYHPNLNLPDYANALFKEALHRLSPGFKLARLCYRLSVWQYLHAAGLVGKAGLCNAISRTDGLFRKAHYALVIPFILKS